MNDFPTTNSIFCPSQVKSRDSEITPTGKQTLYIVLNRVYNYSRVATSKGLSGQPYSNWHCSCNTPIYSTPNED